MNRLYKTVVAPAIVDILVAYSLQKHQAFLVQYVANYIGQLIVLESEYLLVRTVVSAHLVFCYLARFVKLNRLLKQKPGPVDFNEALDVAGLAFIGLSWLMELVLLDEPFSFKRRVRVGLAVSWVILSLGLSVR